MNPSAASEFLRHLVEIPSVNPALTDDLNLAGEARIVEWLEPLFISKGFRTERVEATPGRPNLIARFGSENPQKTILFESHLDTVGVVGFDGDPFVLRKEDGRLIGRGACDTKGPLASFLAALDGEVLTAFLESNAQLAWVGAIGEETGNLGAEEVVVAGLRADECIVLEPTDAHIVHAHKGVCWFTVTTRGLAVHASHPDCGDNAILKMADVWRILEAEVSESALCNHSPSVGQPTVSVGKIAGGVSMNVVPDACTIQVDRRLMPDETADRYLSDIRERLAAIPGGVHVELMKEGIGFDTDTNAELPQRLSGAIAASGVSAELEAAAWCSDAGVLDGACGQTVVWGPGGIAQAHTTDEYIEEAALETGRDILRRFLLATARA